MGVRLPQNLELAKDVSALLGVVDDDENEATLTHEIVSDETISVVLSVVLDHVGCALKVGWPGFKTWVKAEKQAIRKTEPGRMNTGKLGVRMQEKRKSGEQEREHSKRRKRCTRGAEN